MLKPKVYLLCLNNHENTECTQRVKLQTVINALAKQKLKDVIAVVPFNSSRTDVPYKAVIENTRSAQAMLY